MVKSQIHPVTPQQNLMQKYGAYAVEPVLMQGGLQLLVSDL